MPRDKVGVNGGWTGRLRDLYSLPVAYQGSMDNCI